MEEMKLLADGNSLINPNVKREGCVYRDQLGQKSFKNVSREYLLKIHNERILQWIKPKLYVLVGLSGSGKSTLAAQLAESDENTVIVSSDAIREELTGKIEDQSRNNEVFEIFHQRIRKI